MKTKVILIRHGETDWNVECRFLGSADRKLTEKGRRQAGYARAALENEKIDIAYSSPLSRAFETGEIILAGRNMDLIPDPELREITCGEWEGMNGHEVEEKFPGQIYLWGNKPEELIIDGGDSFRAVQDRMVKAFWRIVKENEGKTILITAHMICISLLMMYFEGIRINKIWDVEPIGNGAVNVIEVEGDQAKVTVWNDDSFVPEEEKKGSSLVAGRNYVD